MSRQTTSRALSLDTEWILGDHAFQQICAQFGEPAIDLFAAPENTKCRRFCSWFPTSGAEVVDAFTLHWGGIGFFYAFPPFALILRTLRNIVTVGARGILVVLVWAGQPWFPLFHQLRQSRCLTFLPSSNLLLSADRSTGHRLRRSLQLQATILSGKRSRDRASNRRQSRF